MTGSGRRSQHKCPLEDASQDMVAKHAAYEVFYSVTLPVPLFQRRLSLMLHLHG
jgi:hypothetical protein